MIHANSAELQAFKRQRILLFTLAVLSFLAGVFALASPFVTGLVLTSIVGWTLIALGVLEVISAFQGKDKRSRLALILLGGFTLLGGGIIIAYPVLALGAITFILGLAFLIYGTGKLMFALRWYPFKGWGWVLLSAIVSDVLGLIILMNLADATPWLLGTIIGFDFLMMGFALFMLALAMGSASDQSEKTIELDG